MQSNEHERVTIASYEAMVTKSEQELQEALCAHDNATREQTAAFLAQVEYAENIRGALELANDYMRGSLGNPNWSGVNPYPVIDAALKSRPPRVFNSDEMVEAGCRAMHQAQGTGDADAPRHSPYQNSWDEPDSVRWEQWDETVREVLDAALGASTFAKDSTN